MRRGLKASRLLIANMIPSLNMSNLLEWKKKTIVYYDI